jgi:3-oxoacyl-[acyl-carrier protein] reductase
MKRVMLITGTSRGIGKGLAERYLEKGFIVAGCSRGECSISHPDYRHWTADVADPESVYGLVSDARDEWGRIDYLLNNAGIASMSPLTGSSSKSASEAMAVNFLGSFFFMKEVSKLMMFSGFGRIVNFSSIAVPLLIEGEAIYAASKSAVETMTRISSKELGGYGITVNAVGSAPVETEMLKVFSEEKIKKVLERQAIKRLCGIEDIANVIDFLIDDKSSYVTGQVIYLGGA